MATYQTDVDLLKRVQKAGTQLTRASVWSNGILLRVDDSFLLEMYLLFRIAEDLRHNHKVEYDPGSGGNMHAFPQRPAGKAGRPKFTVHDKANGTVLCQLCAGTAIEDRDGKTRHPDISIQKAAASDTPNDSDVLQILDAKYRTNPTNRLSAGEFAVFINWVNVLALQGGNAAGLQFHALSDLDTDCLVTNGEPSTEPDEACERANVREVTQFHPSTNHQSRP